MGRKELNQTNKQTQKLDSYVESAVNDIFNTQATSNKNVVTSLLFHQK